jgi:predicted transcriptional regulator
MAGKRISPEEVIEFHRLYKIYGTYAEVARRTGRSESSVRRYVGGENIKALARAGQKKF